MDLENVEQWDKIIQCSLSCDSPSSISPFQKYKPGIKDISK